MIKLGLIGHPLEHSLSPEIHRAALKSCNMQGEYSLYPVPPGDVNELGALLNRVRAGEITGLNVTIPHKQNVIPQLDELTPRANAIGAVNTIYLRENKLIGDNTDAHGFLSDLYRFLGNANSKVEEQKSAFVLGAGGSARAVAFAFVEEGWEVGISARRPEQVNDLIAQVQNRDSGLTMIDFTALKSFHPALIVNTTPLGMSPNVEASPWPSNLPFPPYSMVYDLVYNPRQTKLVRDAITAGLPARTGLGMLVEQAALAFEIWTGMVVPREPLFAAVEDQ